MKRIFYSSLLILSITCNGILTAQNIHGKIVDNQKQPIDGATIVLQTLDSTYVDAVISDSLGLFCFNQPAEHTYRLLLQHLLYEPAQKEITSADAGTIILDDKDYTLGEVTVKAERPQVKIEGGKLTYDIPQLMKDKTSTNAFEVIKQLPGITGTSDDIQLVGTNNLNIILNGQLTTMSLQQLIQLLKSMPASRVQKAEIMYAAPAKYNVKGAVINVILDKNMSATPSFQGEVGTDYIQQHYARGKAHANIIYSDSKLNIDFLINGEKGRRFDGENMLARHTLDDKVTEIEQSGRRTKHKNSGVARLGIDYTFANKDKLSAAYYLDAYKVNTDQASNSVFTPMNENRSSESNSITTSKDHSALQNVRLQYDGHTGLTAGMDFTHYKSPSDQHFLDTKDDGTKTDMLNYTKQNISRWSAFTNHTISTESGWSVNYGINGGYTYSRNYLEYLYDKGNGYELDMESFENNVQKDYTGNVFAEVSKSFGKRFSATVALKGEYYRSDYISDNEKTNLWNDWTLFPTASLNYVFSQKHILQLNVNSDKTFPSYMTLSPQSTPLNSYSEVVGNPFLKPYRSYVGQLIYIFRQKYILMFFCDYEPNYFTQLPYQSDTELKNVFRFENMDYSLETGFNLIVPFKVSHFWNARVTLQGYRMQEKSEHFHSMSFNRKTYVGIANMTNTFNLSDKPNLKLNIDGTYVAPGAIQGIYDLGRLYNVSGGLKWTFASNKGSLTLNAYDIFRSSIPTATINQGNQWSHLNKLNDNRSVTLSFVWKFGGFKAKKYENIDTSRFGK
ncbi:outer membrane beta-barrel family protein [Parabacteroides provencensis]|uniref:outer membrane beta-barrel family protein n=1 Tax=Parabacteroides provencensis TaxID=1944636 RepID=UPI000C156C44|nr:outer membrane beta-barrel family protein [Parabacteroides provencensis]